MVVLGSAMGDVRHGCIRDIPSVFTARARSARQETEEAEAAAEAAGGAETGASSYDGAGRGEGEVIDGSSGTSTLGQEPGCSNPANRNLRPRVSG